MAENEKKVRSIRADDETYAKFKAVCDELGGQHEAFTALISAYEIAEAKKLLTGQADTITDFQAKLDGIARAYITALDMSANAEERIELKFRERIESKEKTIQSLQQENDKVKAELEEVEQTYRETIGERNGELLELKTALTAAEERAANASKAQEQAEKISALAGERADQLKAEVEQLQEKAAQSDHNKNAAEQARQTCEQLTTELNAIKEQLKAERERAAADKEKTAAEHKKELELEVKIAVANIREEYQEKMESRIEQLQQQHSEQVATLQKNYAAQLTAYIESSKPKRKSSSKEKNATPTTAE